LTCAAFALSLLAKMPDIPKKYATTASFSVRFFTTVNKSTPGQALLQNIQPTAHTRSLKKSGFDAHEFLPLSAYILIHIKAKQVRIRPQNFILLAHSLYYCPYTEEHLTF
jgi:hypothetical protein